MIGAAGLIVLLFAVLLIVFKRPTLDTTKADLNVWVVMGKDALSQMGQTYTENVHKNVTLHFQTVDAASYENRLLSALAAGEGPDIVMIRNRALPKLQKALSPVSPMQLTQTAFRNLFPQVAEEDFIENGRIYALPLYIDTLSMFYNRDLFDQAGITQIPKTWDDFRNAIPKLVSLDTRGQIVKSAAAIGGSKTTIDAAVDILNLLMLQTGVKMTDSDHRQATFAGSGAGSLGQQAFNFYLQFSNPNYSYYTWNDSQPNSIQSFASGKTAIIFDYHAKKSEIKKRNAFLNFSDAPMPQPAGATVDINYADYWGLAVSKQSRNANWAWDFILYAVTSPDNAAAYAAAINQLPALRPLIANKFANTEFAVQAKQALTARSWYQPDEEQVQNIFNTSIQNVLNGKVNARNALDQANDQIGQLFGDE